ncbi:MAG: NADH-quinone oxidoreductase subunit NuoG [Thermodesulfobacteriota bacterium]|nr:MAG: NADH-quinone oxidoreductase subunit NuoG [Thermodesulfobacteriota bacterium]
MVTVKINGIEVTVEDNTLILDAARQAGIDIPTFCYQADLMGVGSCRMCIVEIEGQKKLQPSCVTPVLHGMSINTETQAVQDARAGVLEFFLANHALDCPVCDKAGECELQDMVYRHGPHTGRHAEPKFKFHEKDYILSPVIVKNSNRCVNCMKCVRVCREVVGANVLGALGRGDHQEATSFARGLLDCDHCGNCIEVCPVGCFMRLPYRYKARPWDLKGADSVCSYCGTGCRIVLEERDGVAVRSRAQLGVGINNETLCARGRFGFDYMTNPARLTTPLIRKSGGLVPASWEEAFEYIRDAAASISPDSIGGIASPRLTNEELYTFQKLIREALGSPNIDSSARWDHEAVEGFISAMAMDRGGVSVLDCVKADTVFVIGAYVSEENPVTDYLIRRFSATRNMNVIIASPRAMKLDSSANLVVRHMPAAEGALLDAVSVAMSGQEPDPKALGQAGISADEAKKIAAKLKGSESVSIMAGTDFLRYPSGIGSLAKISAALEGLGKKVLRLPLLDRCNQRGAWEMGVHPALGPGYSRRETAGAGTDSMLDAARAGSLKMLYLAGTDLVALNGDRGTARDALTKLKLLVVQDMFLTETARLAHVVLPGAALGEKDGTVTNQEGRVQAVKRLTRPPGKAMADLDIMTMLGNAVDPGFPSKIKNASVFDEIRREAGAYELVDLAFNNKKSKGNGHDNKEALVRAAAARLEARLDLNAVAPAGPESYPFVLVTGNHFFHSGTVSLWSETLVGLAREPVVEIGEEDARKLGLSGGERVRVRGKNHEATMLLRVRKGTKKGVAFMPENFEGAPANMFSRRGEGIQRVLIERS